MARPPVHGLSASPIHRRWRCMRWRVAHDPGYKHVTICAEWDDPRAFVKWALDNGFQPGLWLDRRDNEKGYNPDNCRWVTTSESCRNRRWTPARRAAHAQRHAEMVEKIIVPIICDGVRYKSIHDCSQAHGFPRGCLSRALIRGQRVYRGLDIGRVH